MLTTQFECPPTSGELGQYLTQRSNVIALQLHTSKDAGPGLGQSRTLTGQFIRDLALALCCSILRKTNNDVQILHTWSFRKLVQRRKRKWPGSYFNRPPVAPSGHEKKKKQTHTHNLALGYVQPPDLFTSDHKQIQQNPTSLDSPRTGLLALTQLPSRPRCLCTLHWPVASTQSRQRQAS